MLLSSAAQPVGRAQSLTHDRSAEPLSFVDAIRSKVLAGAVALIDALRRMNGKGVKTEEAQIDWAELMRFRRTFTDPVPQRQEQGFRKVGIATFHGVARFTKPGSIEVGSAVLEARHVLIATGAKPSCTSKP